MNLDVFNIDNFNIIEDDENYYFLRALNNGDKNDLDNGIIIDELSHIIKIRTDRERYDGVSRYTESDVVTLEEMFDHIKMHHRTDTNCISLSSNANVSALYGRGYYSDKYVLIKVPKKDMGKSVFNAGPYLIQEIESRIKSFINDGLIDRDTIASLKLIDEAQSQDELDDIIDIYKSPLDGSDEMFQKGIEKVNMNATSVSYQALTQTQNLEKNKIIAKLLIIQKDIIPSTSNKFLIQTIGNAFSSLELIHYGSIKEEEIISIPDYFVDMFSLIQQLPTSFPLLKELKSDVLSLLKNGTILDEFEFKNKEIASETEYTIANMYDLTDGKVSFKDAIDLYRKSFYLAKSRLRAESTIDCFKKVINNPKYDSIFEYLKNYSYGVEPEIFNRSNKGGIKVSESVNLDFGPHEKELYEFVKRMPSSELKYILKKPKKALIQYLDSFKSIKRKDSDKDEYYANAIIDLFDWEKIGVASFSVKTRNELVKKITACSPVKLYEKLKKQGVKEKKIANIMLTMVIKGKKLDEIEENDTFTVEELDDFLGYYKIKDTDSLKLRSYQASTVMNIDKIYERKNFAVSVLPTGAGKSFVSLAEMLKFKNDKILYLAPNDTILEQIKDYIVEHVHGKTNKMTRNEIIKSVFPHLTLRTYSSLLKSVPKEKYDFIVLDELHRTGAKEWNKQVLELLGNQNEDTKILGITATPMRDVDMKNMADEWAKYFGYTDEEIKRREHMASNMDLIEAIRLGYVVNPKIVSCEYTLLEDGSLKKLLDEINSTPDEKEKEELLKKYETLRKKVESADGVDKILLDNVKMGGKYIVFCPVNSDGMDMETIDGEDNDKKVSSSPIIEKYKKELLKYFNSYDVEFYEMLGDYSDKRNREELEGFSIDNDNKIKFMVVMNKLNEGAHVSNIAGIIWFRALDENSHILYSQQLGRIIYGINPNDELLDEDRPVVIDLPNNSVRVRDVIRNASDISDLDELKMVVDWINLHEGKLPDINSQDRIEARYGSILKKIQTKYEDIFLLEEYEDLPNKEEVIAIIELAKSIDLWNNDLPEKLITNKSSTNVGDGNIEYQIEGVLKDFCELQDDLESSSSYFEIHVSEAINWFSENKKMPNSMKDNFDDGKDIYSFLKSNKKKIQEEAPELASLIEEYHPGFFIGISKYEIEFERHVKESMDWFSENKRMPNGRKDKFKDGKEIYSFLNNNKERIQEEVPELASLIKEYYPSFFIGIIKYEIEFERHVKEAIKWILQNKRMPTNMKDNFDDGKDIYSFLKTKKKKIQEETPELASLIEKYHPGFFTGISKFDIEFERHVKESINWILQNKRMPNSMKDNFDDGKDIYSFLKSNKKKIQEEAPELASLIEEYHPSFFIGISKYEIEFERHVKESMDWFSENKRMPNSRKDKFNDGKDIYSFLYSNRMKIQEEVPELASLIKEYYPSFFIGIIKYEIEFERHVKEAINWILQNKRMPNSMKDNFDDGKDIYSFLKTNKKKIQEEVPELASLIEKYHPGYFTGMSKYEIEFERHVKESINWILQNKRMPIGKKDKFNDGENIYGFLNSNRERIQEEATELTSLIEKYHPGFFTGMNKYEIEFERHVKESINWILQNKRMPIGTKDKFDDGKNIYIFLKANKKKMLEKTPELVALIEAYKPDWFSKERELLEKEETFDGVSAFNAAKETQKKKGERKVL